MPSVNSFFLHLKRNNDKETDVIAAKVAMVDLVVELNLPLSTLVRINKVFKKSLRIQTLQKGQLKMFLFLVLSSSFLCLLFFFFVIRGRHVCYPYPMPYPSQYQQISEMEKSNTCIRSQQNHIKVCSNHH